MTNSVGNNKHPVNRFEGMSEEIKLFAKNNKILSIVSLGMTIVVFSVKTLLQRCFTSAKKTQDVATILFSQKPERASEDSNISQDRNILGDRIAHIQRTEKHPSLANAIEQTARALTAVQVQGSIQTNDPENKFANVVNGGRIIYEQMEGQLKEKKSREKIDSAQEEWKNNLKEENTSENNDFINSENGKLLNRLFKDEKIIDDHIFSFLIANNLIRIMQDPLGVDQILYDNLPREYQALLLINRPNLLHENFRIAILLKNPFEQLLSIRDQWHNNVKAEKINDNKALLIRDLIENKEISDVRLILFFIDGGINHDGPYFQSEDGAVKALLLKERPMFADYFPTTENQYKSE